MEFSKIVELTGGKWTHQTETASIDQLLIDSRFANGNSNELFIALKGNQIDGHQFVHALIDQGVRSFIAEEDIETDESVNICQVKSSLEALQQLGKFKRKSFLGEVIAITGSNGKTIVKEWLYTLLSAKFNCIKSPKSYNSQIGVPLSLWLLNNNFDKGIIEAGISQPNEMSILQNLIDPDIGIFTNIGSAHGENFNSVEEKIAEKAKLFAQCQKVICQSDDERIVSSLKGLGNPEVITWGNKTSDKYRFFSSQNKLSLKTSDGTTVEFETPTDRFIYLDNLCHVIVSSLELGLSIEEIQLGLKMINSDDLRLSLKRGLKGNYLIDDTYNNDLEGLKLGLEFMELQNLKEKRVLIISDLVQSSLSESDVQQLRSLVHSKSIEQIVVVGHQLRSVFSNISIPIAEFDSTEDFLNSELVQSLEHRLILIKGSRKFRFEKIIHLLAEKIHKTRLEIDLNAIVHNLKQHKKLLKSSTKIMVMVKAFAYGAGSLELARLLEYQKVDYLGVAYVDEALELRKNGIQLPIMVMNATKEDAPVLIKYNLEPEIYSFDQLKAYLTHYSQVDNVLPCHIIVNTGMNRLGFEVDEAKKLIELIKSNPLVEIKSIFTHLASADDKNEEHFTLTQIHQFEDFSKKLIEELKIQPILHCLNSAGIARFTDYQKDMVRLGVGLHGVSPNNDFAKQLRFPAQLKSTISQIRTVEKGETIGYGRKGKAERDMQIATVAIGYADGFLRILGNSHAYMMVKNQKAFTVGNICMDMTMLDVTGLNAKVGDDVIVFGSHPTIIDLAQWSNTIPYEILTNISGRVQRVFHAD